MMNDLYSHKDIEQQIETLPGELEYNVFNERSEYAQEIISRKPDFFEKWSLIIFLVLLLFLLASTWFIRYPDIVEADAVLMCENAPKEIRSMKNGLITAFFVKNNQQVKKGDILAWIENDASTVEIVNLEKKLTTALTLLEQKRANELPALFEQRLLNLGELQAPYERFISALQQFNGYLASGYFYKRKNVRPQNFAGLEKVYDQANNHKNFLQQEGSLVQTTFDVNETLEEYHSTHVVMINQQQSKPKVDVNSVPRQNQRSHKKKQVDKFGQNIMQQRKIFERALYTFGNDVHNWLLQHTIHAEMDGQVIFGLPVQSNRYVEKNKLLGYIKPSYNRYYAEIKLSQNNFGKVDTGMKVQLRFDAYPFHENGCIVGTLNYISEMAIDNDFLGLVELGDTVKTNFKKQVRLKHGLKGKALIVTDDIRLLERLYNSIMKSVSFNE